MLKEPMAIRPTFIKYFENLDAKIEPITIPIPANIITP